MSSAPRPQGLDDDRDETAEEQPPDPIALLARRAARALRRRLTGPQRVTLIAIALIVGQLVFRTWATAGSWFMWDDYIFLSNVALHQDDFAWLFHSHFSLFMPFSFLLVKIVGGAGFSWGLIAAQMLILQLLASVACWWMLRSLFGDRRLILIPLAFYLASPLTMPSSVWWSVAINQLPHHIAIFGAVAAHVNFLRTKRLRHVVLAWTFLILGLGSYVKAPLIVPVLMVLTLMWFTTGPWRARLRAVASLWPVWLLYVTTLVGYFLIWRSQQLGSTPRQSCELPESLKTSILETVGTGIVGGPWNWTLWSGGIDPFIAASKCVPQSYKGDPNLLVGGAPQSLLSPSLLGIVLAWLLLASLLVYRWGRHHRALMSLWFVVPYVVLSAGLVYAGRAGTFGSQVSAREIRYFSDVAAIGALALGTALMPIVGARQSVRRREQPLLLVAIPRRGFMTIAVLFLAGSLWSTITYAAPWHDTHDATRFPERAFISEVITQLSERDDLPVLVADVPLPIVVANPVIYPYNLPSRKLAPLAPDLQAVTAGTDLSILDAGGRIQMANIPDSPRAEPGPVENCGYLLQSGTVTVPIIPVLDLPWWVRIDYLASDDGSVTVEAGRSTHTLQVRKGLHSMFFATEGAYDDVLLRTSGGITLCADNVHVGNITPKVEDRTP